jgi:hypothetical protein
LKTVLQKFLEKLLHNELYFETTGDFKMIAEPPISDIRAKAEARRAKTLARERDRLKAAKGEKVQQLHKFKH